MKVRAWHSEVALLACATVLLAACGGSNCTLAGITVTPPNATADHAAPASGNSQQFLAWAQPSAGCVAATQSSNLPDVTWSVSDPVNVMISNTPGPTYGTATCVGPTAGPVTITAGGPWVPAPSGTKVAAHQIIGTATLTCK